MPDNFISILLAAIMLGIWLLAMIRLWIMAIRNKHAPVTTVSAEVTDKHTLESFDKYAGNGKHVQYVVVFSAGGKKKSFYVSKFSYGGYRLHEKGTLKYKGDRLISFR